MSFKALFFSVLYRIFKYNFLENSTLNETMLLLFLYLFLHVQSSPVQIQPVYANTKIQSSSKNNRCGACVVQIQTRAKYGGPM